MTRLLALALVLSLGACHKKATEGGAGFEQVSDALDSAGFKISGFQAIDPSRFSAQKCVSGPLSGLDTVVCEYSTAGASAHGKKAGESWIGNATTGAVLANGRALLAVADRIHSDPNGKTIHKITQAFLKAR